MTFKSKMVNALLFFKIVKSHQEIQSPGSQPEADKPTKRFGDVYRFSAGYELNGGLPNVECPPFCN